MKTKAELVEALARAMCTYQDQAPDRVLESMDRHRQPVIMWTHWKGEADAALSALRQWLADEGLVCVPLDFIAGPNAWLASWAQHVGNCKGGYKCECGLVAARHDLARAMIAAAPDALETKP